MNFMLRDLFITLLPEYLDHFASGTCDAGSPRPPGPGAFANSELSPVELRMVLQLALIQLGGAIRADELRPRSIDELNSLEERLTQALEEVRNLRQKMDVQG
jgi:hypothetical protein